jgi:DNA-binding transcriptional ArsR family regulator
MSKSIEDTQEKQLKWFDLLRFVKGCPAVVLDPFGREVKIQGSKRLVLWCLAHHADGDTWETFVKLDTIIRETGLEDKAVDRAISDLKRAGLLTATRRFNPATKTGWSNIWTLDRERLEKEMERGSMEREYQKVLRALKEYENDAFKDGRDGDEVGLWWDLPEGDFARFTEGLKRLSGETVEVWSEAAPDQDGKKMIKMHVITHKPSKKSASTSEEVTNQEKTSHGNS